MPKRLLPDIDSVLPPSWAEKRWPVMLLALVAVAGVAAMFGWLASGGPAAPSTGRVQAALPTQMYAYPKTRFTTEIQQRRVRFSAVNQPTGSRVFAALSTKDLTAVPSTTTALETRQSAEKAALAADGYDTSAEGFLNAARKGDLTNLMRYLRIGLSPNAINAFGSTPLFAAAEANQMEAAKLLVAAGGDVNAVNTRQQTPLHRAVEQGNQAMAELLLAVGANPALTTLDGWPPFFYAIQLGNQSMAQVLLARGASVNQADKLGLTPLALAVRQNNGTLAAFLINHGADVKAVDIAGRTTLHMAVDGGSYALAKQLLEAGAPVNARTRQGSTAMDIALSRQNMALANLLLAHGGQRPRVLGN